jgi:hypothetical protein
MIEGYNSGRMTVDGKRYHHDLKIIRNRVVPDWWRREDHRLDREDVEDILSSNPDVVVVGIGYAGNMRVSESLRSVLSQRSIRLIAESTNEAMLTFNRLSSEGKNVAGAFHLTC